ncbi:phage tail assembly chaperone [Achromobacter ruhlandii]|uniref:phage tail assembly chaperone n=1 Tax=Achromobacter ruhlandii TaxID=72557 RepID=UPI003BA22CEF
MFYYSKSRAGFFRTDIHDWLPPDCVEVSVEQHAALMFAQSEGKEIVGGEDGAPIAIAPAPLTGEQRAAIGRAQRDEALRSSDWLVARHRDEIDAGAGTSITADQFKEVQEYRQALRDWPHSPDFPDTASMSEPAGWLRALLS